MEDELMLRRAKQGDPAAFEQLVTPHEAMLWRTCWHLMGNTEDAKDALQETMLKAWRAIGGYRGDASLATWLYRVAVSCCTDMQRKQKLRRTESMDAMRETGFDPADQTPGPEVQTEQKERREQLRRALNQLPEEMRTVLILTCVDGRSYEETAEALGIALGTVKSRCNRARAKLAEILAKETEQSDAARVKQDRRRVAK